MGLNHRTAPVEVRERFAVAANALGKTSAEMTELSAIEEAVVLSTCNRMEIYLAVSDVDQAQQQATTFLAQGDDLSSEDAEHFYYKPSADAARHLCRVVSGLDSMVLGETEIFGQVKQAYTAALDAKATKGTLNKLFQKSFGVGKKVRTQTSIQGGQTSVGSVAVDLAEKIFGRLNNSQVLVIGAGEQSRITAQSLLLRGAKKFIVTNRSFENAQTLAEELKGEAVPFGDWEHALVNVDVVVSSTGASNAVVLPEHVEKMRRKRKYRPLFMIDIAVPRDIDPAVGDIEEVYLYDLDTLQGIAEQGRANRVEQVRICEEIIEGELPNIYTQSSS